MGSMLRSFLGFQGFRVLLVFLLLCGGGSGGCAWWVGAGLRKPKLWARALGYKSGSPATATAWASFGGLMAAQESLWAAQATRCVLRYVYELNVVFHAT